MFEMSLTTGAAKTNPIRHHDAQPTWQDITTRTPRSRRRR
jgi:hypothetical protein